MKKIIKKTLLSLGLLTPIVAIPIATSFSNFKTAKMNNFFEQSNNSKVANLNEYYNYDSTILEQSVKNINIKNVYNSNNQFDHQTLAFEYNFDFRDFIPDKGYADVFLQLTKLDFLFENMYVYNENNQKINVPFQFNFNYTENDISNILSNVNIDTNSEIKSFTKVSSNSSDYDFPFGNYEGKQFELKLNENLFNKLYCFSSQSNTEIEFKKIINLNDSSLIVVRDPTIENIKYNNCIQFSFKFVTNTGYKFSLNEQNNLTKKFNLKVTSNYFINSSSNVVYDKVVLASNRMTIWNPVLYSNINRLYPLNNTKEKNQKINFRKIYFDSSNPIINLNNIHLGDSLNKNYKVNIYLTNVLFGIENQNDWVFSKKIPLNFEVNLNPNSNNMLVLSKDFELYNGISLNVKLKLVQDKNDKLKYYLGDLDNSNTNVEEIKNNGYVELTLVTTNDQFDYENTSKIRTYGAIINDNFDVLSILEPDFNIRTIVNYIKTSINHDIVINYEQKNLINNRTNSTIINSQSGINDIFDNSYIGSKISNKQLIINEINSRIETFLKLQDVQFWINNDSQNNLDLFFPVQLEFSYKNIFDSTNVNIENGAYSQGVVSVKLEPRQNNNLIFKSFEFNVNVYATKNSNWKKLLTPELYYDNIKKLFNKYYSWEQLKADLDSSLDKRKELLSNLLIVNNNNISTTLFNSIIQDISLEVVENNYYLNISLNTNNYCFYDADKSVYTQSIRLNLGKQTYKEPDKTYFIDLEFDAQKMFDTIFKNYTNLDDFLNDYNSMEEKLSFFTIKSNKDRIQDVKFEKTSVDNELKIIVLTKSGFENDLYCVSKINNLDFSYSEMDSSYSITISNLLLKGQESTLKKVDLLFSEYQLWDIIHNFNSFNEFLSEFNSNPKIIDNVLSIIEYNSDNKVIVSQSKNSYNSCIESIKIEQTSTNQRIKVTIKLKNGYQYYDQSSYNTSKTFYLGNILTYLEDPNFEPYKLLQPISLYLDKEKITKLKLNENNLDNFVNSFNEDNTPYLDLFLNNHSTNIDVKSILQAEHIYADWYKNENGKSILRFTVCLKNGYYFSNNNLTKSHSYSKFYNQYEINVDSLLNNDQLLIGGKKVDKSLVIGLGVGGGILLIATIITVWSLIVHFNNKRRLERSRGE